MQIVRLRENSFLNRTVCLDYTISIVLKQRITDTIRHYIVILSFAYIIMKHVVQN